MPLINRTPKPPDDSAPKSPEKQGYREVEMNSCEKLILAQHYSHRLPSAVKLCYADIDYGPPRVTKACCIYSIATGRWEEMLWELTRLVRLPEYDAPLTKLISKSVGHIRANKLIDLLISFADMEEDHHGGIYQASSWIYDGLRSERLDGFNIDGEFVPARTCNALYGTSSVTELAKKLEGSVVEPHFDSGKHCYWKALTKEGMQKALRIGLRSRPYPKPMIVNGSEKNLAVEPVLKKGVVQLPGQKCNIGAPSVQRFDGGEEL